FAIKPRETTVAREQSRAEPHSTVGCLGHRLNRTSNQAILCGVIAKRFAAFLGRGGIVARHTLRGAEPPDTARLLTPKISDVVIQQTVVRRQVGELFAVESRHATPCGD